MDKAVLAMALLRVLSGSIELTAAYLIYRFNQVDKALLVNSSLALVGPLIFIGVTAVGMIHLADKLSFSKLLWVLLGVSCIFIGILKK
ncbi:YqhV family protein [Paenibacillus sp. y28]|uniref:YqhV family protein n=1 Tax=Paenibacillus sp. y28 TaxID=3129110 RepID=UPI00301609E1